MNTEPRRETKPRSQAECPDERLTKLIAERRPVVSRFYRSCGLRHDDNEDLTQETLLNALRACRQCRNRDCINGWLRRIARNVYARWISTRRTELGLSAALDVEYDRDREAVVLQNVVLGDALARVPESRRALLSGHYLDGLSYKEIGSAADAPKTSITNELHAARRQLRDILSRQDLWGLLLITVLPFLADVNSFGLA